MANILEETWFIGVMAGVGAVIVILIVVIVVLCCLWAGRIKKGQEERIQHKNNNEEEGSTNTENWTLVQPGVKFSPPSSTNTSRIIRGNEANVAGSSLIHMDKEMRANAMNMATQTTLTQENIEKVLKEDKYNGALNGDLGRGTEVNSSSKFTRSEFRVSYQKPRIANVSVSSMKGNGSSYNYNSQLASPYPYRIPTEDYDNPGFLMYATVEKSSRNSAASERGKVKEIATSYEKRENNSPPTSPSRKEVELEIKEIKESESTAPIKKRLSNRATAGSTPQKRLSSYINEDFDEVKEDYQQHPSRLVTSGKSTIETRVSRYKKVGAVSVFPD